MMIIKNKMVVSLACVIGFSIPAITPVYANDAGAFFGGVLASHVVRNVRERNAAEQTQTVAVPQYQSNSSSKPSTKERIEELDKLAAGGYITPKEYKRKKQAIIDSL